MIYIFSAVFFIIGVAVGLMFALWVFSKMAVMGRLLFKADGEWVGEKGAIAEVKGLK